jgi:hypothetical protein
MVISGSHALISSDPVSTISEAAGLVSRVLADPQMAGAVSSGSFLISLVDRFGRRIDPVVLQQIRKVAAYLYVCFFEERIASNANRL